MIIILNSSLTEEATAKVLGLSDFRSIALEAAYNNSYVECFHSLRDSLCQMQIGNTSVSDFGQKFKIIYDKLAAIGQLVDDMDKIN